MAGYAPNPSRSQAVAAITNVSIQEVDDEIPQELSGICSPQELST